MVINAHERDDGARHFPCRVVAIDQRGYGDSSNPAAVADYSTALLAKDVDDLIHGLREPSRGVVGAESAYTNRCPVGASAGEFSELSHRAGTMPLAADFFFTMWFRVSATVLLHGCAHGQRVGHRRRGHPLPGPVPSPYRIAGYDSAVVVGHDVGGAVAWRLALAFPDSVRRLVVCSSPHPAVEARMMRTSAAQRSRSWSARARYSSVL